MKRFAVIGTPIAHSSSPKMQSAAFAALGLPHTYEAIETSEGELPSRIDALRAGTFAGLNVTIPHKTRVLALVDAIDASAAAVNAANTLVRTADGRIRAHNTDVLALGAEISRIGAGSLRDRSCVLLGSGGAARAAIGALAGLDAKSIVVRARAFETAERARAFESEVRRSGVDVVAATLRAPAAEASDLAVIVQATSLGMVGADAGEIVADAVAWSSVPRDAIAIDVVYAPPKTPFLVRAEAFGLRCDNGLGMLAAQGEAAFELWLGIEAPPGVMRAALDRGQSGM